MQIQQKHTSTQSGKQALAHQHKMATIATQSSRALLKTQQAARPAGEEGSAHPTDTRAAAAPLRMDGALLFILASCMSLTAGVCRPSRAVRVSCRAQKKGWVHECVCVRIFQLTLRPSLRLRRKHSLAVANAHECTRLVCV
eukprot:1136567-Pelagomonas_calceolata.AAC.4